MSPTYAANTSVAVETSRAEIERTLQRYGATSFAYGWDQDKALIEFAAQGRRVRFILTLPDRQAQEFTTYTRGTATKTLDPIEELLDAPMADEDAEGGGWPRHLADRLCAYFDLTGPASLQWVRRARLRGGLCVEEGDAVAVALGMHPSLLWPEWVSLAPELT